MAQNLVTLQEYKTYVGINTPTEDALINSLINKTSDFVKTYCKRGFIDYVGEAKVETFQGGGSTYLLQEFPVKSVLSLEYSQDYGNSYVELVEYLDWVLDSTGAVVLISGTKTFDSKPNSYKVTYFAGYDTVPGDLKLAVMDLITYYRRNDSAIHSTKAAGSNNVQIEYISTTSLPAHIKRVLDLYMNSYN